MLTALRTGWSKRFEIDDMPFFLCQITPYDYGFKNEQADPGNIEIREEMERFGLSNGDRVGCAVLSDIGELDCIHPGDKRTVGTRLAALALNRIYGMKNGQGYLPTDIKSGYGITADSRLPFLKSLLEKLLTDNAFLKVPVLRFLFSPALYVDLLLLALAVMLRGRNRKLLLIPLFLFFLVLTVVLGPGILPRYAWPLIVCAPVLVRLAMRSVPASGIRGAGKTA
jgi:hypothetical protein